MKMTTREFLSPRFRCQSKLGAAVIVALAIGVASPAWAGTDDNVNRAYDLAAEGLAAYKSGNYNDALSHFERAFEITHLPALAVHMARANVKLGHLVSALAIYRQTIQLGDGIGDADVQARARADAQVELNALTPRIPRIRITVTGVPSTSATVFVDGTKVPTESFAAGWLVDPGQHTVVAWNGKETVRKLATVVEGELAEIQLSFVPAMVAEETQPKRQSQGVEMSNGKAPTLAWVSYGAGGVGLLVAGVATIGATLNRHYANETGCNREPRGSTCDEAAVNRYSTFRTIAVVSFYTGVAGVVAGTAFYFAAPHQKKSRDAKRHVLPWLGLESAGIEGSF